MTRYVRVREDAASARSFGLVPGASYPLSLERDEASSLRVIAFSGERVAVPKGLLEPFSVTMSA